MLWPTLLSCAVALVAAAPTPNSPSVTTSQGTWIGERSRRVESFRGIPFALPPVGNLRFAPPVAATKNFGVYDASVSASFLLLSTRADSPCVELRLLLSSSQRARWGEHFVPFVLAAPRRNRSLTPASRPQAVPGALGRLVEGGFELIQSLPFISASLGGNQSEDCLTINVQRPANIKAGVKLPVMFWVSAAHSLDSKYKADF